MIQQRHLTHVPRDVFVRIEPRAGVRLVVNHGRLQPHAVLGELRVIEVHRVVRRRRRVRRVRVEVQHPQEELLVAAGVDEVDSLVDRIGAQHPGDRVELMLVRSGHRRGEPLEHVKALVETGALGRAGVQLVHDGVGREAAGDETVVAQDLCKGRQTVGELAAHVLDAVPIGQPAGHERRDARRGPRRGGDGVGETRPACGDRVDIRGVWDAAVAAEVVDARRVEVNDDDAANVVTLDDTFVIVEPDGRRQRRDCEHDADRDDLPGAGEFPDLVSHRASIDVTGQ